MKKIVLFIMLFSLLVIPAAAEEAVVSRHKLLVLDEPYALIEDWTNLEYTRERFGLGTFKITLPEDHTQAAALVQYNRVLIVRGDEDWDNQENRLWGMILDIKWFYAEDAGPDVGGSGEGAAFVTALGVTYTDYYLNSRCYPLPELIDLVPDGEGAIAEWAGTFADIDEGVDSHDGDDTYINTTAEAIELFTLSDYVDPGTVIAGIRIRSVWRTVKAGVITPTVWLRLADYNEVISSPIADGADTGNWVGAYTDVDDNPLGDGEGDGDTTFINSNTVGHQESYEFQNIGIGSNGVFYGVWLNFRARRTTGDPTIILPYVLIGGTRYYSDPMTLADAYATYSGVWYGNPATELFWTTQDINNAEFGLEIDTADGGDARVTMVYVVAQYYFEYQLGHVEDSYEERYVDIVKNPATEEPWTKADLDSLQVGVRNLEDWDSRVTALDVRVHHKAIHVANPLDDVLKAWVNANLGSGADADRLVTGFAEEADESAFPVEDETGGSFGLEYHGLSLVNGQAFYRCEGVDLSSYIGWWLKLVDSSAKVTSGWIKEADATESLGAELITNGGFAADTTGWTAGSGATLDSVAGGQAGNCLRITEGVNPSPYAYQDLTLVEGKLYKLTCYIKQGTESTWFINAYDTDNSSFIASDTGESTAAWVLHTFYFTVPVGCSTVRIRIYNIAAGGGVTTIFYDTVVCKEVVHVGIDGVHIVQTRNGDYRGWEDIEADFDYNDSAYTFDVLPAYEIAYNLLLQRFLELCKLHDVGMDVVGAWAGGANRLDGGAISVEKGALFGPAYHGLSLADGVAFIRIEGVDLSGFAGTEGSDTPYKFKLIDSAGAEAEGHIGAADAAEALGGELVTDGGFEAAAWDNGDLNNWLKFHAADDKEAGDPGAGAISVKITASDTFPQIYQNFAVAAGKLYKLTFIYKNTAGDTARYWVRDNTAAVDIIFWLGLADSTSWSGVQTIYFTAPSGCISARIGLGGKNTDDIVYFDSVSVKEVTHVGADGVHIVSALNGSTRNWASVESDFDYNDTYTFEVLAAYQYQFQTTVPEGVNRTHSQSDDTPVVISRGRGIVRMLDYELDVVSARNVLYMLGESDGLKQAVQVVAGDGPALAKQDRGLLLKQDGWPILLSHIPGRYRREAVLDVEGADDTTQLISQADKFLGDEGAELEMVKYEHSAVAIYVPLTDFLPGDFITFYDEKLNIGPLQPKVEMIGCAIGGDGVERYEVQLGVVKRPALSEDAAFRAVAKRKTLYVKSS